MILISFSSSYAKSDGNYGYIKFTTNIDTFFVTFNNDYKNSFVCIKGDSIKTEIGKHYITISGFGFKDISHSVELIQNKTLNIKFIVNAKDRKLQSDICMINYLKGNVFIETDTLNKVMINDTILISGNKMLYLESGKYILKVEHITGFSLSKEIFVEPEKLTIISAYIKPNFYYNLFFSFIPGASSIYQNMINKGIVYSGIFGFSTVFGYSMINQENNANWIWIPFTVYSLILIDSIYPPDLGFRFSDNEAIKLPDHLYYKTK